MIRLLLAVACVVLGVGQARADDILHFGPQPAWVAPVAAPAAKPADGVITIRVADFQVRIDDKGIHTFARQIIRVNTPEGLQFAGTLAVAWQPGLMVATVNRAVIRRGAETIDVMKDGKGFQILRRESQLESAAMISGVLTAVLPIPDLRVGDEVELAYSVDASNPVLAGHAESMMPLTKMFATDRMSLRYSWPVGRAVRWKAGPLLPPLTMSKIDGFQVVSLASDGWTTPELPVGAPGRYANAALFQVADFADWQAVAGLMRPLYAKASSIAPDSAIMAEVKRIAALSPDPKVRASEALRVVQSQVRYLARLEGLGAYTPESADAVWAARTGDCKGKTVLLLAMLRALGVTAEPALVSATDGDGLDQSLPMPGRFNHVIVKATIGDQTYWLDGTRMGDRGVDTIAVPGFSWALPLDSDKGLTALAATEPSLPLTDDRLDLDARAGIDKPAKASGTLIYRGDIGTQMRIGYLTIPAAQRDQMIRKIWADRYSWITVDTADYRVDDKTGDVVLSFTGTAKMDWSTGGADLDRRYVADNAALGGDLAPKREKAPDAAPVAVEARYSMSRETILLPDGGKGFAVEGDAFDRSYGGVRYVRDYSLKDGKFEMSATTRSKPGEISYADATAADKQTDVLIKKMLYLTAPATFGAPADVATTASAPAKPGDVAPDTGIIEITRLTRMGNNDEALKLLDARIAGGDRTAKAMAMRGQLLRNLERTDGARDAYDHALAIDRREPLAITGKAEMLITAGRDEDALILYDRLVLLWPEAEEGYRRRATVRAGLGQVDGALSDLDILIGKAPDDLEARTLRTSLYLQRGRADDAIADARALVKLKPDDATAHALLATVLATAGKRAEAIAATEKSLAIKPDGDPYRIRLRFGLEADDKARLADMVALIKYEPWADLPVAPLKKLMVLPAARTAILQAYDAALVESPDNADAITGQRDQAIAVGGDPKAYIAGIDARLAKKPANADLLNEACWARAWLKVDLDAALKQCDTSIAADRSAMTLDSRGLVRLQRGEWAKAAADYGDAVALRATMASALYGRGIARKRQGDLAGSKTDIAAATALDPRIADVFAAYGVAP